MVLENRTLACHRAEQFIVEKLRGIKTEFPRNRKLGKELHLELKWCTGKRDVNGYCRYSDFYISCRVNRDLKYPHTFEDSVGTVKGNSGFTWTWVMKSVTLASPDEAMIYIVGHEMWHFLCKTKQASGNFQTKANANGIRWLEEFRKWMVE